MKIGSVDINAVLKSRKTRRLGLMVAFYAVLGLLLLSIVSSYMVTSNPHLSAYDDDWDDLSAFRADLKNMGVDTTSMISSPVLLGEIENPEYGIHLVTGVEISIPFLCHDLPVTLTLFNSASRKGTLPPRLMQSSSMSPPEAPCWSWTILVIRQDLRTNSTWDTADINCMMKKHGPENWVTNMSG